MTTSLGMLPGDTDNEKKRKQTCLFGPRSGDPTHDQGTTWGNTLVSYMLHSNCSDGRGTIFTGEKPEGLKSVCHLKEFPLSELEIT